MYAKLALRNVKRSLGDYAIYVLTLILSITLIFAYNSLLFSDAIASFNKLMGQMMSILLCVTIMVVLILGWLISYITRFIFEQRSREFACYMTMGMERRTMSRLFLTEQLIIGISTLFVGIVLGNFFYLVLSQVIFRMFDKSYYMDLSFQLPAVGLTVLCFFIMFALSLLRQNKILKKIRIKELMHYERKNEKSSTNKGKHIKAKLILAVLTGIFGILCLGTAFVQKLSGFFGIFLMVSGVLLQGISLLLFYRHLSENILIRYKKNEKRRLHHLNIFFYRQLTGRLKTNGKQMGVISILLLLTLLGLGGAAFMANSYETSLAKSVPFDIEVSERYGTLDVESCRDFVRQRSTVTTEHSYHIYRLNDSEIIATLLKKKRSEENEFEDLADSQNKDRAIRLSDYNALLKMLGRETVSLKTDEYYIQTDEEYYAGKFEKALPTLTTEGKEYKLKAVQKSDFAQNMINESGTNTGSILVLPDETLNILTGERQCYFAMTADREQTEYKYELRQFLEEKKVSEGASFIAVYTYAGEKSELQAIYMMLAFICCYAAFICIFICATILAVQLLSSSKKYRYQYEQLQRMGAGDVEIRRLIWKQILVYFAVPIMLPFLFVIIYVAGISYFSPVVSKTLLLSFAGANGIFLFIYGCYFIITCLQYQKNVLQQQKKLHLRNLL